MPTVSERDLRRSGSIMAEEWCRLYCRRERPSKERFYNGGGAVPTVSERDLRRSGSIMAEERCRL